MIGRSVSIVTKVRAGIPVESGFDWIQEEDNSSVVYEYGVQGVSEAQ
jgi:hypothetical protein